MSKFSLLNSLPLELVLNILDHVSDYETLLKCREVCHNLKDLVDQTPTLQYTINLAVAGQESCCANVDSPAALLNALKRHQNAWDELKWSRQSRLPMRSGGLWELYGGVLAQSDEKGGISFIRLPSDLRSIEEKQWSLGPSFPCSVRDFAMDLSQDLLLLIEKPHWVGQTADHTYRLHIRTLTTGEPHPEAKGGTILSNIQTFRDEDTSYTIQISGHYVGVLFNSVHVDGTELVIWDWKTSQVQMHLVGNQIRSFSFLSQAFVVICLFREVDDGDYVPVLLIVDVEKETERPQRPSDVQYSFSFHFPHLEEDVHQLAFQIQSDPVPLWQAHRDPRVPFYMDKNNSLYVVSLWVQVEDAVRCVTTLVPSTTFLACINGVDSKDPADHKVDFVWDFWGPRGTRMIEPAQPHSIVWVCYVYGSKYVVSETGENASLSIKIYDFNQLALKRGLSTAPHTQTTASSAKLLQHDVSLGQQTQYQIFPTLLEGGDIFEEDVQTFLPYRSRTLALPFNYKCSVMCSEDSIIIVDSRLDHREYTLLTF